MAKKKESEVMVVDADILAQLQEAYPVEEGSNRIMLPRLSMASQDKMEGKGKDKKVVTVGGTFFLEHESDEKNSDGKNIWVKDELGMEIEVTVLYQRKQARMYEDEVYTSSPVFDTDDEIIPLFCNRKEVNRGTIEELQSQYMYTNKKGKEVSSLEVDTVLYVRYEGEIYQMNLRGSSKWSFSSFKRGKVIPAIVIGIVGEYNQNGDVEWYKMIFSEVRGVTQQEAVANLEDIRRIKNTIEVEKKNFGNVAKKSGDQEAEDRLNALGTGGTPADKGGF